MEAISSSDERRQRSRPRSPPRPGASAAASVSPPHPAARRDAAAARPCALYLVVFSIYPLVASLVRSFQDYDHAREHVDLGRPRELQRALPSSDEFWNTVENTLAPDVRGGRDPGRARHGARALLQPAAPGRDDRPRDPRPADAADADRRRPDVAGAPQPGVGAAQLGLRRARLRLHRLALRPEHRALDARHRRLLAVDAVRLRDRLRPATGAAAGGVRGGLGRRRQLVPADASTSRSRC